MPDLLTRSAEHRRETRAPKAFGEERSSSDARKIMRLAESAVTLAARQRRQFRGGHLSPDDRAEAVSELVTRIYAGDTPTLTDLIDSESPTMAATADGRMITDRPSGRIVKAAGSILDGMRENRQPGEDGFSILTLSAESRESANARRSVRSQLLDPERMKDGKPECQPGEGYQSDPLPPEVADSLDRAGFWPDDPMRVAIAIRVSRPTPTADDLLSAPMGSGKTAAAIRKAAQRASKRLEAAATGEKMDPDLTAFASYLRDAITPTAEERREAARRALAALIESEPD